MDIDISQLTPGQLMGIVSQLKALEKAAKDAQVAHVLAYAQSALDEFDVETFDSGAVGLYLNAKGNVLVPDPTDGNDGGFRPREVTVSVNVRFTDTIPARKPKAA